MLKKFITRDDYSNYNDFIKNYKINMPEDFNYAYDIVDKIADEEPDRLAMVWCDDNGKEKFFTFRQMKAYSNKAANFFKSLGIKRAILLCLSLKEDMNSGFVYLVYINWELFLFLQLIYLRQKILYIEIMQQMLKW